MKVVINGCFGGFGLSEAALAEYNKLKSAKGEAICEWDNDIARDDPDLITVVETMGKEANGNYANLIVRIIPDGSIYHITEYDGNEGIKINKAGTLLDKVDIDTLDLETCRSLLHQIKRHYLHGLGSY